MPRQLHMLRQDTRRETGERLAETLRARDPNFDLTAFSQRVERAFRAIQEAWSEQDLSRVRGFMSDGLHERFAIQLREQADFGYRNRMENIRVHDVALVETRSFEHFDVASVRIAASACDWREDLECGRELRNTRRDEYFVEVWSFLRGRGASAPSEGEGLLGGQCPNCSAPVEPERAWECRSCGSALDSAPPDWVLTEITQNCEWRPGEGAEPDWLKRASDRDPGLTIQALEDRASVLFWRLMDSDRRGRADELASVARSGFLEHQRSWLKSADDHFVGDCSVGAVTLRGIIPGEEWDLALAEIRWAGSVFERNDRGEIKPTDSRSLRRELLVMARRAGVESRVGRCITSAHCGGCGAPDEGSLDGACAFCGAPLNDGRDWLIDRFLKMGESEAAQLLYEAERADPVDVEPVRSDAGLAATEAALDPALGSAEPLPGGQELFAWCLRMAYADDGFDRRERERLQAMAERLGLHPKEARRMAKAAQFGRLTVESPTSAAETRLWIGALTELASADGEIAPEERAVLEDLEQRFAGEA